MNQQTCSRRAKTVSRAYQILEQQRAESAKKAALSRLALMLRINARQEAVQNVDSDGIWYSIKIDRRTGFIRFEGNLKKAYEMLCKYYKELSIEQDNFITLNNTVGYLPTRLANATMSPEVKTLQQKRMKVTGLLSFFLII
ncbi:MAG: hypothetical protein FWE01_03385 [Firmicutes bacterium]|nr:hypothetical protein [Bacillota bacterium]